MLELRKLGLLQDENDKIDLSKPKEKSGKRQHGMTEIS